MNQQSTNRLEDALASGYSFQIGEYISKGFNIFGRNAGMFLGYILIYLFLTVCLGLIPILGQLVSVLISGALAAGVYIVADKTDRNEDVQFGNFFDGFQSWTPLFVSIVLQVVIFIAAIIPFMFYFFAKMDFVNLSSFEDRPDLSVLDGFVAFAFFATLMYLAFSFIYAPLFIVFDKMDAWESLQMSRKFVGKHLFAHVLFLFAWGIILIISALPIGLGLLVTIPAVSCSVYAAWADITNYHVEQNDDDDLLRHLIG